MKNEDAKFASCIGIVLVLLIVVLMEIVGQGLALSVLWNWFVVPIFGLTALTVWQAYGITLVFATLNWNSAKSKSESSGDGFDNALVKAILSILLRPAFLIFVG